MPEASLEGGKPFFSGAVYAEPARRIAVSDEMPAGIRYFFRRNLKRRGKIADKVLFAVGKRLKNLLNRLHGG